jgi:hypothetical protein
MVMGNLIDKFEKSLVRCKDRTTRDIDLKIGTNMDNEGLR